MWHAGVEFTDSLKAGLAKRWQFGAWSIMKRLYDIRRMHTEIKKYEKRQVYDGYGDI